MEKAIVVKESLNKESMKWRKHLKPLRKESISLPSRRYTVYVLKKGSYSVMVEAQACSIYPHDLHLVFK